MSTVQVTFISHLEYCQKSTSAPWYYSGSFQSIIHREAITISKLQIWYYCLFKSWLYYFLNQPQTFPSFAPNILKVWPLLLSFFLITYFFSVLEMDPEPHIYSQLFWHWTSFSDFSFSLVWPSFSHTRFQPCCTQKACCNCRFPALLFPVSMPSLELPFT